MDTSQRNCGCASGGVAALIALGVYLGYLLLRPEAPIATSGLLRRVLMGVGVTMAAAVVGKLAGIVVGSALGATRARVARGRA